MQTTFIQQCTMHTTSTTHDFDYYYYFWFMVTGNEDFSKKWRFLLKVQEFKTEQFKNGGFSLKKQDFKIKQLIRVDKTLKLDSG